MASRPLRDIRQEAEKTDRALLRAGASGDLASKQIGGSSSQSNYSNAERALSRVDSQAQSTGNSFGFLRNRIVMIGGALLGLAPAVVQTIGVLGQLSSSLISAAGGAGVIGGGLLGAFAVGLGAVGFVLKDTMSAVKASQQAFTSYNQAVQMYGQHSSQAATAAARLNVQLKLAPQNTLALLNNLKSLSLEWDRVTSKSQGAIVALAAYGTGRLSDALPGLASSLINPSVSAFTAAGKTLFDRLLSPESIKTFTQLAQGFQRMIGPLVDMIANLGQAFGHLAVIALPFSERFVKSLDTWSQRFMAASRDTAYFHAMFSALVSDFRTWMSFFGATLNFLRTFVEYTKGGSGEIKGITDALKDWTAWIRDNPAKMNRFFEGSTQMASDLGKAVKFVWDVFAGLSNTLAPTWQLIRQLLGTVGPPLLKLLLAITSTISILTQSFSFLGQPNSALAIVLNSITKMVDAFNWLLIHVPFLAQIIGGGLLLLGLYKMVAAIGGFVTGVGKSIAGMLTLTGETNAAAAATERLAAAQRTAMAAGGYFIPGGAAGGAGLAEDAAAASRGVIPLGGAGSRMNPLIGGTGATAAGESIGGVEAAAAAGGGASLLARILGRTGMTGLASKLGLGAKLGSLSEAASPYGIAALLGSSALAMVPSKYVGGQKASSILSDVATGAGIGSLGGLAGGPLAPLTVGAGALLGAGGGLAYGVYKHLLSGGGSGSADDALLRSVLTGSAGSSAGRMRADQAGNLGSYNFSHEGLTAQLAGSGGSNPTTPSQYATQISALSVALRQLGNDQSSQAQQAVQAIETQLAGLKRMQGVVDAEAEHARTMQVDSLGHRIGLGATIVDKSQGPAAAMDFIRKQVIDRWSGLGEEGKKQLAAAVVQWGQEVVKQRPGLKAEFDKILDGPIGSIVKQNGRIVTEGGTVVTNMKATMSRLAAAMKTPSETALEQTKQNLTQVQDQMIKLYMALGMTRSNATALVHGQDAAGTLSTLPILGGPTPSWVGVHSATSDSAGITPNQATTPTGRAHVFHTGGGRIGGTGMEDTVHLGGGNMAAPGELIVNQHTENRVNRMLGGRATLGSLVSSEGRPHSAFKMGGRLSASTVATHGTQTPQRIILHSTESSADASSIAAFWRSQGLGYGSQYEVGQDGAVTQFAPPTLITWHTGGANTGSVGIEMSGFASWSRSQWNQHPAELSSVAGLISQLAGSYGIPLTVDTSRGVSTHAMQSKIHPESMGHWDPGPGFPLDAVMRTVGGGTGKVGPVSVGGSQGRSTGGAATQSTVTRAAASKPAHADFTGLPGAGLSLSALTGSVVTMAGKQQSDLASDPTSLASSTPTPASYISGTGNAAANQRLGYQMMSAAGFGADQWPALLALWNGESGWNQFAYNSSSGATGIPQSLPGNKMASAGPDWKTDPATQIKWGLDYIQGRYGSPSSAYAAWTARDPHWYGDGGEFVTRRPQLIGVGEKGPEHVKITPLRGSSSEFAGSGSAGGRTVMVNVRIDRIDASGDPNDIKEMVTGQIRDAIAEVADELTRVGHVSEEQLTR